MRVVRQENPEEIEVKCTGKGNGGAGCGAVLAIIQQDIHKTESSDYAGFSTDYYATICCPKCKVLTDLKPPSDWTAWQKRKSESPEQIKKQYV